MHEAAGGRGPARTGSIRGVGLCLLALLGSSGCVPMPVHLMPSVRGQVLDEASGRPVEGAVVVVRFDVRHGDLLPDRDLLAHREAVSDAKGHFRMAWGARPGFAAWPLMRTEARIVGVIKEGYRCGSPLRVKGKPVTLRLEEAAGQGARRASCRPVAARPSEAPEYLAAWRALYPRDGGSGRLVDERPLERLLEARRIFGSGDNCRGPVSDLSLAPGGERAAVSVARGERESIEVIELSGSPSRVASLQRPIEPDAARPRRLAWSNGGELVLWEPASALDRDLGGSGLIAAGPGPEVVWRGALPPARRATAGSALEPVQATDLNDEGDARWQGRSFQLMHSLDPLTGLARSELHTHTPAGEEFAISLPGESCGPSGQYGRPHYRIAAGGEIGLDLRYVDGGCHAVAIHLTSGEWRRLDSSRAGGTCNDTRRVPLPHLRAAMRGYVRDLEETLHAAGGNPQSSYTLRIDGRGRTTLDSHDYLGERLKLVVAPFPLETPLRRIDVTAVANAGEGSVQPRPRELQEGVLEPL